MPHGRGGADRAGRPERRSSLRSTRWSGMGRRRIGGGRVTYDDRPPAFAKIAAFDYAAEWLRTEHANYETLAGQPVPLDRCSGGTTTGSEPGLVLEDLSGGVWPPPWTTSGSMPSLASARARCRPHRRPPRSRDEFGRAVRHPGRDGTPIRADPSGALTLGVFDRRWLSRHTLDTLEAAAAAVGRPRRRRPAARRRPERQSLLPRRPRAARRLELGLPRHPRLLDVAVVAPEPQRTRAAPNPGRSCPGHGRARRAPRRVLPRACRARSRSRRRRTSGSCSSIKGVVALRWACRELGICPTRLRRHIAPARHCYNRRRWPPPPLDYADVLDLLRSRGLRMTPQRRAIVSEVMRTKGHISPARDRPNDRG